MNAARAYEYVIAGGGSAGSAGCVIDASVMTSLPRANTSLAVMTIAENWRQRSCLIEPLPSPLVKTGMCSTCRKDLSNV